MSAEALLKRAVDGMPEDCVPDDNFWRDYYLYTGQHMILTEECWQSGENKQELIDEYGADYIEDEINAPTGGN